ncbi:hypothetical protein [Paenibacillus periandrae]|uniref:hypothetical protein n=1 Tax=Paenibacillus periandrae TaxID=1761741 RepID=UPI001F08AC7F|nr:hypothetical protein [Paenibacillus periandrae]
MAGAVMITLVDVGGRLTSAASKSQIIYAFLVPEGLEALEIRFNYSPKLLEDRERARELVALAAPRYMEEPQLSKYLECWERVLPLQNLLTLSLDDQYRFRGAAHRHTPVQEHRLGANDAEPGFLQGPIVAGMWRITVSVHAIVTEVCSYELQVNGVEKERSHHE